MWRHSFKSEHRMLPRTFLLLLALLTASVAPAAAGGPSGITTPANLITYLNSLAGNHIISGQFTENDGTEPAESLWLRADYEHPAINRAISRDDRLRCSATADNREWDLLLLSTTDYPLCFERPRRS